MNNIMAKDFKRYDVYLPKIHDKYYTMLNDVLTEIDIHTVEFKYCDSIDKYEQRVLCLDSNGVEHYIEKYTNIYGSPEEYEQNISIGSFSVNTYYIIKMLSNNILNNQNYYWEFSTDNPVRKNIELNSFLYNLKTQKFFCGEFFVKQNNIYATKEDCLSYNYYYIKDKEGHTICKHGINKLVLPTKEQKDLLQALKTILNELSKADIRLIFDATDRLYAYNTKNVKTFDIDYDDDYDKTIYKKVDRLNDKFKIDNINIEYWGEDADAYVSRLD